MFFTGSVEGLLSRRHRGRHLAGMMGTIILTTKRGYPEAFLNKIKKKRKEKKEI